MSVAGTIAGLRRRPQALLLKLRNVPIFDALRLEEALFRVDNRTWIITNEWDAAGGPSSLTGEHMLPTSATSIVLGISGRVAELVDINRTREAGVPLCRRFSGGGTVVVDTKCANACGQSIQVLWICIAHGHVRVACI